jgi:hypothetical protein
MSDKIEELSQKDLDFYKERYFDHFGVATNIDEGMGSILDFMDKIQKAIETDTPLVNFDLDKSPVF